MRGRSDQILYLLAREQVPERLEHELIPMCPPVQLTAAEARRLPKICALWIKILVVGHRSIIKRIQYFSNGLC